MARRLFAALACLLLPLAASAGPARPKKKKITLKDLAPRWEDLSKPQPVAKPYLTAEQLDALYNGAKFHPTGIPVRADDWRPEVSVQNEQLKRASLTYRPLGFGIEGGYLGTASRNTLFGPSPYVGIRETIDCAPDHWIDCKVRMQGALVQVNARYFNDNASKDASVDRFSQGIADLMREGGTSESQIGEFQGYSNYDDPYRTTQIFVGSLLGQAGRAYGLLGPVDVGWTVTGLMRVSHFFPNIAADASMGTRVRLGDDRSLMVSGGATHNASPVGNRLLQGFLTDDHPRYGYNGETAPHAAVQYRGSIPGEEGLVVDVMAYRQWNQLTQLNKVRAALGTDIGGRPTELGGELMTEKGPEIEYDRTRQTADLTRHFSRTVAGTVSMYNEDFLYGSAHVNQQSWMLGLKVDLDGGSDPGSVSASHVFNAQDKVAKPQTDFVKAAHELNQAISQALSLAEAAQLSIHQHPSPYAGNADKDPERMEALATSMRNIPPATRDAYRLTLLASTTDPQEQAMINELFTGDHLDRSADGLDKGAHVLRLMSDNGVIERFAARVLRNRILAFLDKIDVQVPLVDASFRWSPGVFLAAAHALSGRLSPDAPITEADRKEVLEPFLWKQAARNLNLPPTATPEEITAALIAHAPPDVQAQLQSGGAATLKAFVEALSGQMMHEFDELMVNLTLAAEQEFDQLTVDGGRKAGELGTIGLSGSFDNYDARNGRYHRKILEKLAARYKF